MCLKVISSFVEIGIRINHDWWAIVCCVEDVDIALSVGFQENTHPIAFLKNAAGLSTHCQPVWISHEKSESQAKALGIYRGWFRSLVFGLGLVVIQIGVRALVINVNVLVVRARVLVR